MKAIRVDPGMFYPHYKNAHDAIVGVLADLRAWSADTVFVFAASPLYGSYYQSNHPGTLKSNRIQGESYLRAENFLARFVEAVSDAGIDVVASFRMNQFQHLAELHPDWVSRTKSAPYRTEIYGAASWLNPLSAHVPAYRDSFRALIRDAVARMPRLAGIEACEGNVAESGEEGDGMPDRHPLGWQHFQTLLPHGAVGDQDWRDHRSDALTELHEVLREEAGPRNTYVIHDLPTTNFSVHLQPSKPYGRGCGFDWDDIVGLGYDHPILSAIWQQREGEARRNGHPNRYGPDWTAVAAQEFGHRYPGRTCYTHVEATPFEGVAPSPQDLADAADSALSASSGVTVYSYDQLKTADGHGHYVANAHGRALAEVFRRY